MIDDPARLKKFWAKVKIGESLNDCWEWTGARHYKLGYGVFLIRGRNYPTAYAHRIAYTLAKGKIPDGLVVDHLCRNTSCVNPRHLQAVTKQVNFQRSAIGSTFYCPQGHKFTPENTYRTKKNCRQCRQCHREGERRRQARRKEGKQEVGRSR